MPKSNTKAGQTAHLEANLITPIVASDDVDVTTPGALVHCNKTGNYNLMLTGMQAPQKLYLIAGVSYPLRIKRLLVTDTDQVDGLMAISSVFVETDK